MTSQCPERPRRRRHVCVPLGVPLGAPLGAPRRELLEALVSGHSLDTVVPVALEIAERDPLVAAVCFPGDLLRGLMEVPGRFWGPNPGLYERYLTVVRAGAAARRRLPPEQRMAFWGPLELDTVRRAARDGPDGPAPADREPARG